MAVSVPGAHGVSSGRRHLAHGWTTALVAALLLVVGAAGRADAITVGPTASVPAPIPTTLEWKGTIHAWTTLAFIGNGTQDTLDPVGEWSTTIGWDAVATLTPGTAPVWQFTELDGAALLFDPLFHSSCVANFSARPGFTLPVNLSTLPGGAQQVSQNISQVASVSYFAGQPGALQADQKCVPDAQRSAQDAFPIDYAANDFLTYAPSQFPALQAAKTVSAVFQPGTTTVTTVTSTFDQQALTQPGSTGPTDGLTITQSITVRPPPPPTDCLVSFYVDAPPNGLPTNTGHAFVQVRPGDGGIVTRGFYPIGFGVFDSPGELRDDGGSPWSYRLVYHVTSNQCADAQAALSHAPAHNYGLLAFNCTGFVKDVADSLGLALPDVVGPLGVPDPRTLAFNMGLNVGPYHDGLIEANNGGTDANGAPGPFQTSVGFGGGGPGLASELAAAPGLASALGFRYVEFDLGSVTVGVGQLLTLTRATATGPAALYNVDWGDGSTDMFLRPLSASIDTLPVSLSHAYHVPGRYSERLSVLTGGEIDTYTGTVIVTATGAAAAQQFPVPAPPPSAPFPPIAQRDTTPPTSALAPSPLTPNGSNGWYRTTPSVGATADDGAGSGVAATRCSLDSSGSPRGYADLLLAGTPTTCPAIAVDGVHTFVAASVDHAGNAQAPATSLTVKVDTKAPTLTLPADRIVNATSSQGAVQTFTATATDTTSGPVTQAAGCAPASGSTFPIGDTRVTCSASDNAGNVAGGQFAVHVRGPAEQFSDLRAAVQGVGAGRSLDAKVGVAQQDLAVGNRVGARQVLTDLINEVQAQSGKKIPAALATTLIADATRIRALIPA